MIGINHVCSIIVIVQWHQHLIYGGESFGMNDHHNRQDIIWKLVPGGHTLPVGIPSIREELTPELQKYLHVLGPTPKRCLETLADLGLSDTEIGRYFKMPGIFVTQLRQIWRIDGE